MDREMVVEAIKNKMAETIKINAVAILFGSRARGDNKIDSDWDILILVDLPGRISPFDMGKIIYPIYELGEELGIEINPLLYTMDEWKRRSFMPIYKNIEKEGIRIWG